MQIDNIYQWLVDDIAPVKTPGVFEFHRGLSGRELMEIEEEGSLPEDYRMFLMKFGGGGLFRHWMHSSFILWFERKPRTLGRENGDKWLFIGLYENSSLILKKSEKCRSYDPQVYMVVGGCGLKSIGNAFNDGLKSLYSKAKGKFGVRR